MEHHHGQDGDDEEAEGIADELYKQSPSVVKEISYLNGVNET